MEQSNKNFMANNPQFGSASKPMGSAPQPGMTSYIPMGATAKNPNTNVAQPSKVLPIKQTAQTSAVGNNGYLGSSDALKSYPQRVQEVGNFDINNDPGYQSALGRQRDFESQYSNSQANSSTQSNPFGYMSNLMGITGARYAQQAPIFQSQVEQAKEVAGTRLGAQVSAMGASAPVQVSPGNFYVSPTTGQDITGGIVNPGTGGARLAQVDLGRSAALNKPVIANASNFANNFNSILASHPELQQSGTALVNLLNNVYSSNQSDPNLMQLQSSFNGALENYAQVLGMTKEQLVTELSTTARGQSLSSLFANIDARAREKNSETERASTNPGYTPPSLNAPTANTGTPGVTRSGIKYTIIQ